MLADRCPIVIRFIQVLLSLIPDWYMPINSLCCVPLSSFTMQEYTPWADTSLRSNLTELKVPSAANTLFSQFAVSMSTARLVHWPAAQLDLLAEWQTTS